MTPDHTLDRKSKITLFATLANRDSLMAGEQPQEEEEQLLDNRPLASRTRNRWVVRTAQDTGHTGHKGSMGHHKPPKITVHDS